MTRTMSLCAPIFTCLYGLTLLSTSTYQLFKEKKYHTSSIKDKISAKLKSIYEKVISFKSKIHEMEVCSGVFYIGSGVCRVLSQLFENGPIKRTLLQSPLRLMSNNFYLLTGIIFLVNSAQILHEVNQTIPGKSGLEREILKDLKQTMVINIVSSILCILATSLLLFGCPILLCMTLQFLSGSLDSVNILIDVFRGGLSDFIKKIIEF